MRARRSVRSCAGPDEEPDWEPDWKPDWKPDWEPDWEPDWKPRGAAEGTRVSQMVRPGAEVPLDFVQ